MDRNLIILSAETGANTVGENRVRTERLNGMLQDLRLDFTTAMGCLNGKLENSFVVFYKNTDEYVAVRDFAFVNFDQEAILHYSADDNETYLVLDEGGSQYIGDLVEVNPKETDRLENFTIVNNRVFTTIKS